MIAFGSSLGGQFVLDTVLVVAGWVDHTIRDFRQRLVGVTSDLHMRMTLEPWYGWGDERTFRFYVGATPDDPVEGMYSFVPARQVDGVRSGFARPAIELWGLVNPNVRMQARTSPAIPLSEIATCWREIAKGVLDSGLVLATRLEEPGGEA